jgi:hypothetical protein
LVVEDLQLVDWLWSFVGAKTASFLAFVGDFTGCFGADPVGFGSGNFGGTD